MAKPPRGAVGYLPEFTVNSGVTDLPAINRKEGEK
jgi:hypothetical protein